jgi:hypothetical protein
MKKGSGKRKGGAYERAICKQLSSWWSEGKHTDLCWRSASSGAKGTISRTKTKAYHGDIVAVDSKMQMFFDTFSVELKHYKVIDFGSILHCRSMLLDFWKQSLKSAISSNREPILIAKANHLPDIIGVSENLVNYFRTFKKKLPYISYGNKVFFFNLKAVLELIEPADIKAYILL